MPSNDYDVIIVGAGPAGATLSFLLAKSGINTLLIERDAYFEREFRGPAYQPCVLEYFQEMGILSEVLSVDHSILREFHITDSGKPFYSMKLSSLPSPYNYAVAMQQGPLLRKLIQCASEFPNLTFLGNTTAADLITTNGMVAGVKTTINGEEKEIRSRLVAACDGRFSTLRQAAGIEMKKVKQHFDLVWFDFPQEEGMTYEFGLEISDEGIVVFIPQEQGHVRVGWVLQKGGWTKLRQDGIEAFRNRLMKAKPVLKGKLPKILTSFDQCSYLDVKIATAKKWMIDGLLLLGDAAHVASPVGAQGNKLAIQDAVAAHPYIVNTIKNKSGTVRTYHLRDYLRIRKIEIHKIFRWQQFLGQMILGVQNPLLKALRKSLFPLVSPLISSHVLKAIAYGYKPISVAKDLFEYHTDYGRKHRYYLLKVSRVVKETENAYSFYFSIPEDYQEQFQYKPGQFLTLRLLEKGQLHKRCYSLSSTPENDNFLRITVKRIQGGLISNELIDNVQENSKILVLPPAGNFTAPENAVRFFMIAGGSGITPVISLIRSLLKKQQVQLITLVYANHDEASIIFKSELDMLQQHHGHRFQLIHNLTESKTGRLTQDKIEQLIANENEATEYFICGPKGLLELALKTLKSKQIPDKRIHIEKYTSLAEPYENIQSEESDPWIVGESPETDKGEEKQIHIVLEGKESAITCKGRETILDAALRHNLNPPFSCREGICATCTAQLKSGKVIMDKHQALSDEEAKKGKILTCQAKPLTKEAVVEYE